MSDGSIKISIDVDGKQVLVAAKELDKLEESGHKSGKGIKSAEGSMGSLSDSSSRASKDVKGASDSLEDLGDSGSNAGKDLKGADSAIDGLSDSSAEAASSVKGASDSLDGLADSGADAGKELKGADGAIDGITDSSGEAASSVKGTADSLDGMSDSASEAASAAKKAGDETKGVGDEAEKASSNAKKFAVSLGLIAIAATAFAVLKSSMDDAISRFDTLNKFPKVLQALGVSAEESEKAMGNLSDGIDGLPTKLDDIAASAQDMYITFGDMDTATDTALALNNALLGSGASADQARRGTQQYTKSLQTGKFDMMTWNTLSETMGVGLVKVGEKFGFAADSAKNDLYKALQNGSITLEEFNGKLIEVGTGTGIMAELAKENSLGIATSLGNLKYAAARGIAGIIESFDKLSKEVTGKDIAENLDSMKHVVMAAFGVIQNVIKGTTPIVILFADGVKATIPIVNALSPAIIGLMASYASYAVITKVTAAIKASNAILLIAQASQKGLTVATNAQIASAVGQAAVTKAVAAAKAKDVVLTHAQKVAIAQKAVADKGEMMASAAVLGLTNARSIATGVLTGAISVSTVVQTIATAATYAYGAAIKFLMGPVSWIIAGIGLLVAGTIALVKWFKRSSEEGERLGKQTDELAESTDALNEAVDESSSAYEKNQEKIKTNAKTNAELAKQIDELSKVEGKSAADKKLLNSYVEELNESVDGLNLVYGEESDALSLSSEQMAQRIELMEAQESMQSSQERLTEIIREQIEIEGQLEDINALRDEWNQKLDDGSVKGREHKKALEELEEQEASLSEANTLAGEQRLLTEEQIIESSKAVADATEESTGRQQLLFEELSESQQAAVESMQSSWETYEEAATDMFNKLSEKSEVSISEMTTNLEENQRIIGKWAENIATLAERGVDEGLLETLREAGPESAGHVNALVNASDAELMKLSDKFAEGGDVATKALSTSLGIEESGVMEAVGHLVADTSSTLREQMESQDFESIGGAVPEGLAEGIKDGSKEATDATKKMADDTTKAAKGALDINSPSGVYKEVGASIPEGLVLGINSGSTDVVQAIQKMFKSVQDDSSKSFKNITKDYDKAVSDIETSLKRLPEVTQKALHNMLSRLKDGATLQIGVMKVLSRDLISPFDNTPSQFNTIGQNAMSGLNYGLNSGRGRVMSTARSIANSITKTMQSALRIHSPSRVMEDDVGHEVVAGVAVGIDKNAGMVYKALDRLSSGMILSSTPEMALNTGSMGRNAMSVDGVGRSSTGVTENKYNSVDMKGLFNGAVFNVRDDNDIPKIAKQLDDYIRGKARGSGVVMP